MTDLYNYTNASVVWAISKQDIAAAQKNLSN
jgi:hypothetical protein